jgi:hypothetical protein
MSTHDNRLSPSRPVEYDGIEYEDLPLKHPVAVPGQFRPRNPSSLPLESRAHRAEVHSLARRSPEGPSSLFLVRIPLRHRIFAYLLLVRRQLIWLAATRRLSYPRLARSHWRVPKLLVRTLVNP